MSAELPPPPPLPKAAKKRGRKKTNPQLAPADQAAAKLQQALWAGFVVYLQNPGTSITGVWETARLTKEDGAPFIRDCVSQETFARSAASNGWVARREAHWAEVRAKVEATLMSEHVQQTIVGLETLAAAKVVALQHITGDTAAGIKPVQPKSLEGVIGAMTQLTRVESVLRQQIVDQTADAATRASSVRAGQDPQLPDVSPLVADDDGFTDEEIEAMARAAAARNAHGYTPPTAIEERPAPLPPASPLAAPRPVVQLERVVMEPDP